MRKFARPLDAVIAVLRRVFGALSSALIAAMAIVGAVDVISTNVSGYPVPIAAELSSALLPAAVFLAMGGAQHKGAHIRVDLLEAVFSPRIIRLTTVLAVAVGCLVFAGLSYGSWQLAIKSVWIDERAVAAIRFHIWPSKIAAAAGATLALLVALRQLGAMFASTEEDRTKAEIRD